MLRVPYLLFYPDRNHDDRPDRDPDVLLSGFGMQDAQSLANHLTWGPDGWLYGVNGSTTTCQIRGIEFQQGVWRYHPSSDPISCPSTHPIVTSLHGRTTSVHLSLRSALQGEDLASLKQGAVLKKGVWIAYPSPVLFNLKTDISERFNVAEHYPEVVQSIQEAVKRHQQSMASRL